MYVLFIDDDIFRIIERMGRIRDDAYVSSSSLGGVTGVKVCHLRLHLVSTVDTTVSNKRDGRMEWRNIERERDKQNERQRNIKVITREKGLVGSMHGRKSRGQGDESPRIWSGGR